MGTVQKTVSVPIPEGECGNSPSVPETPGQGEENSQAGNSKNFFVSNLFFMVSVISSIVCYLPA